MKNIITRFQKGKNMQVKGFILPFTMLLTVLVLFVVTSSMTLLSKQLYFSKLHKQSQFAYYAADDASACAVAIDDTYIGNDGLGIFPSASSTDLDGSESEAYMNNVLTELKSRDPNFAALASVSDIKCAQSLIFDPSPTLSNFKVSVTDYQYNPQLPALPETGKTSTYLMKMPLGDGTFRCAKVTVNKTQSFRQIIAQGYATCDTKNVALERAVVNETITQ